MVTASTAGRATSTNNTSNDSNNNNDDNGNDNDNDRRIRIHPAILVILLSLIVNFTRARLKDWGFIASSSSSSSKRFPQGLIKQQQQQQQQEMSLSSSIGTQVISNYIQDIEILQKLNNKTLWSECTQLNQKKLLWMDYNANPNNIWEELAIAIWKDHPIIGEKKSSSSLENNDKNQSDFSFAGYEYWCNIIKPELSLDWHVDKDEIVLKESKYTVLSTPYMGAVFYGFPHIYTGGGYIEIFPFTPFQIPDPNLITDLNDHIERFQANYNRLVFLNVSQWHRVTPITDGARYTFACNIWKEKPRQILNGRN